jgi:hypothetical protein
MCPAKTSLALKSKFLAALDRSNEAPTKWWWHKSPLLFLGLKVSELHYLPRFLPMQSEKRNGSFKPPNNGQDSTVCLSAAGQVRPVRLHQPVEPLAM